LAARDIGARRRLRRVPQQVDVAGDERLHRRAAAAIGHVHQADAGAPREQLGGKMRRGADPAGRVGDRRGTDLGGRDHIGDRAERRIAGREHEQRHARDLRHRREVRERVVVEVHQRRCHRVGEHAEQQGVAVRLGMHHGARREAGAGARPVLDHHLLADERRHPLRQDARDRVDGAAGREPDHDAQRPLREGGAREARGGKQAGDPAGAARELPARKRPAQLARLSSTCTPRWRSVR
jgi:hypothetical protein